MPSPALTVDLRPDRDRLVLRCRGELDHFSATGLRDALSEAVASGWRRIVLNLSRLDFMDAGGVHLLEELRDGVHGDADWAMVDGTAAVSLPIEVLALARLLPSADVGG